MQNSRLDIRLIDPGYGGGSLSLPGFVRFVQQNAFAHGTGGWDISRPSHSKDATGGAGSTSDVHHTMGHERCAPVLCTGQRND